ncbi:hypothetical protein Dimus_028717 [Dionaea muscipula]
MARNEEKAQSMLNRFITMKQEEKKKLKERRSSSILLSINSRSAGSSFSSDGLFDDEIQFGGCCILGLVDYILETFIVALQI